ncbi:MAG: DNA topoisomerase VI subunit B [Promethearchaeota archaeon]
MGEIYETISPADFFYRNRDIAGFDNPSRALYTAVRELIENSLDACESANIPPDINLQLIKSRGNEYQLRVEDNGSGIPAENIPPAFGKVLYGSKYTLRQLRGTFGLGGTMAILYGQITTHRAVKVISSTGNNEINEMEIKIDIQNNVPLIEKSVIRPNKNNWHGIIVDLFLEGDYIRARSKILEYIRQTAVVTPYVNLTFIDPTGALYNFSRVTTNLPAPPKVVLPHPYGVDVEILSRIIRKTNTQTLTNFLTKHFHRVGKTIARRFLQFAGLSPKTDPKSLNSKAVLTLVRAMKEFPEFLPPSTDCLSPIGVNLLKAGIDKELEPEFVEPVQRPPSAYSGHPFIVEVAIAYGGKIPSEKDFILYRFANKIPLLYDAYSDVSMKVIRKIKWHRYNIKPEMPIVLIVHLCSTKIPYKTVGKEFIADKPEIEYEIEWGLKECARKLKRYLARKEHFKRQRMRFSALSEHLSKIAEYSAKLAGKEKTPDIKKLLERMES